MGLFLLIASALLAKLGYYQLIKGQEIARQAVAMRSRQVELKEYNRGEILDRNLLPITGTQTSTALYCLPREMTRNQTQDTNTYRKAAKSAEQNLVRTTQILSGIIASGDSSHLASVENKTETVESKSRTVPTCLSTDLYTQLKQAMNSGKPFVRIASNLTPEETARINSSQLSGVVAAPVIRRYREDGFMAHILGYCSGGQNQ
mgnify:FL=1